MKNFDFHSIADTVQSAMDEAQRELHHAFGTVDDLNDVHSGKETVREFPVGRQSRFTLRNVHAGEVLVDAGDESVIRVRATTHGALNTLSEEPFDFRHDGNHVIVEPRGRFHSAPIDYHVVLPRDCSVRVKGINADIRVKHAQSGAELEVVNGDITLENVSGPFAISTVSGDIAASHLSGTLQVHTTSGDTRVSDSRLQRFVLQSVSGDFEIETPLTADEQNLISTTSGDVHLRVAGEVGATVTFKTFSGNVASDLPMEVIKSSRRNWQGRINGGGSYIEMTSTSGDLRVERANGRSTFESVSEEVSAAAPMTDTTPRQSVPNDVPAPQQSESPPLDAETGAVLAALERGEITVEEAMEKLESQR